MAQKETAAKNKRIQKLIAPKLQADPSGLNQAKWKLPPNSKKGARNELRQKGRIQEARNQNSKIPNRWLK
jgi:hypothetical protein